MAQVDGSGVCPPDASVANPCVLLSGAVPWGRGPDFFRNPSRRSSRVKMRQQVAIAHQHGDASRRQKSLARSAAR